MYSDQQSLLVWLPSIVIKNINIQMVEKTSRLTPAKYLKGIIPRHSLFLCQIYLNVFNSPDFHIESQECVEKHI